MRLSFFVYRSFVTKVCKIQKLPSEIYLLVTEYFYGIWTYFMFLDSCIGPILNIGNFMGRKK